MAKVCNVWQAIEAAAGLSGSYIPIGREKDLLLALNRYEPGSKNEFHHHVGTSQSFLVLKGELTIRTKDGENPIEVHQLKDGDCVLVKNGEYYQLENESSEPLFLYQAKQPTDMLQILGREPVQAREHFGDRV